MNSLIKLAAAGLFLIALAINIKVTLDDPFAMLSEDAIAQTSSVSSSSTSNWYDDDADHYNEDGEYTESGQGRGYSWGQQPRDSGGTVRVTGTISFDNTGKLTFAGGASEASNYTLIDCCNTSNQNSSCDFSANNNNCGRY